MAPNRLHIIMASNSDWVVPAGIDERRFVVLDVDGAKQQDEKYFEGLQNELDTGGYEALLYDLLQRDLTGFNHRRPPKTKALVDQKLLSLEPVPQWWFERLQTGKFTEEAFEGNWEVVSTSTVHESYLQSQKEVGRTHRGSQTELGMRLRSVLPSGFPKRFKQKRADGQPSAAVSFYRFPSLDECRAHFARLVGLENFVWEAEDEGVV